jgi:hypothetical protein
MMSASSAASTASRVCSPWSSGSMTKPCSTPVRRVWTKSAPVRSPSDWCARFARAGRRLFDLQPKVLRYASLTVRALPIGG